MSHPLLELMRRGESGAAGYNAYNRGTYVDAQGQERIRGADRPIDFSSLTVGQVLDLQATGRQDPDRLFAIGKYQIIPKTMQGAVATLGIQRDQPFTPHLQDRIFSDYLITQKRPAIQGYITGQRGVTLEQAQHQLSCEWASFGDPSKGGASHYGGANHASITLEQSERALNQMRDQYRQSLARGAEPGDAWREVTRSNVTSMQTQTQAASIAPKHRTPPLADGGLRLGESGAPITRLQQRLNALGARDAHGHALKEDGSFGKHTSEAIVAFQRSHGLDANGSVGPQTLSALTVSERARSHQAGDASSHAPVSATGTHALAPRGANADGELTAGEHGRDVTRLQRSLNRLGYTDAHGHALKEDGLFGRNTVEAVKAFQRAHGLADDGVAGAKTQGALTKADAGLLTNPAHPHHAYFEQMLHKVHEAESRNGVRAGAHSEKLASALVVEGLREGLQRVDRVEFNDTGTLARAVQVATARDEPALNRSTDAISTQQAMRQSVAESSQQAHQVAVNVRAQEEDRQRNHAVAPAM